ncbi:hypothetical protein OAO87_01990 [bacterium]|nr:hypothetical protein [bacterium]
MPLLEIGDRRDGGEIVEAPTDPGSPDRLLVLHLVLHLASCSISKRYDGPPVRKCHQQATQLPCGAARGLRAGGCRT